MPRTNTMFSYYFVLVAAAITILYTSFIYQQEVNNDDEADTFDDLNMNLSDFSVQINVTDHAFKKFVDYSRLTADERDEDVEVQEFRRMQEKAK